MSLLFNMLSRLVIAFLPRSKCLLISWLQSPSAVILETPKLKSVTVSIVSPSICYKVLGLHAMTFRFSMLGFKPIFSLSSFTSIKRLFNSSSLSTIRVVSSVYLRLLIFLPTFLMMYSAYKLNKQGDNIQSWCTPFPILHQSIVPCLVLLLLNLWVSQETSKVVCYSHLFKNFSQFVVIHTVKVFSIVSEAETAIN